MHSFAPCSRRLKHFRTAPYCSVLLHFMCWVTTFWCKWRWWHCSKDHCVHKEAPPLLNDTNDTLTISWSWKTSGFHWLGERVAQQAVCGWLYCRQSTLHVTHWLMTICHSVRSDQRVGPWMVTQPCCWKAFSMMSPSPSAEHTHKNTLAEKTNQALEAVGDCNRTSRGTNVIWAPLFTSPLVSQPSSSGSLCPGCSSEATGPCAERAQSLRRSCLFFWTVAGSEMCSTAPRT